MPPEGPSKRKRRPCSEGDSHHALEEDDSQDPKRHRSGHDMSGSTSIGALQGDEAQPDVNSHRSRRSHRDMEEGEVFASDATSPGPSSSSVKTEAGAQHDPRETAFWDALAHSLAAAPGGGGRRPSYATPSDSTTTSAQQHGPPTLMELQHTITRSDAQASRICGLHPLLRPVKFVPMHVPTKTVRIEPSYTVATFSPAGRQSQPSLHKSSMWDAISLAVADLGFTPEELRMLALREAGETMLKCPKAILIDASVLLNWFGTVARGANGGEITLWYLQRALGIPMILLKAQKGDYAWKRPMQEACSDEYRRAINRETGPFIGLHREPSGDRWSLVLNVGDPDYQRPPPPPSSE